jgi:hypothetical protein
MGQSPTPHSPLVIFPHVCEVEFKVVSTYSIDTEYKFVSFQILICVTAKGHEPHHFIIEPSM